MAIYAEMKKKISDLEMYEVNYAIKRAKGELCFIRNWNGVECFSVDQVPSFTIEQECGDSVIESYSFYVGFLVKLESNTAFDSMQDILKKVDFENGEYKVLVDRKGNIGEAKNAKLGNAYAFALLKSYYGNNQDAEVLVGEKVRNSSIPHDMSFPGAKPEGIKQSSFYN